MYCPPGTFYIEDTIYSLSDVSGKVRVCELVAEKAKTPDTNAPGVSIFQFKLLLFFQIISLNS